MKWLTSAPANLMVMGEHSVVAGHNAIATAINQRLSIEWETRTDQLVVIQSDLANHQTTLQALDDHPKLQWVMKTLQYFQPKLTRGLTLKITSEFKSTLGLGSSAAVLAATLGGLQFLLTKNKDLISLADNKANFTQNFTIGLSIIQTIQKRGSGADLAASLAGGLILFNPQQQRITTLNQAETSLDLSLIYCGYKMPTADVLARVAQQWSTQPELLNELYQLMGHTTNLAFSALSQHNLKSFYSLVNQYQGLMDALGVNDQTLSQIIYNTRAMPSILASKISGSGLGDCVLAFGQLSQQDEFINSRQPMKIQTDSQGLICQLIEA